mmetsp:Transcript_37238/g.74424  ORF Transcript_37238/g.74424 Transcript_37238/m.74424 type:complete len:239 (-) Transcript_37238:300-1016(-)
MMAAASFHSRGVSRPRLPNMVTVCTWLLKMVRNGTASCISRGRYTTCQMITATTVAKVVANAPQIAMIMMASLRSHAAQSKPYELVGYMRLPKLEHESGGKPLHTRGRTRKLQELRMARGDASASYAKRMSATSKNSRRLSVSSSLGSVPEIGFGPIESSISEERPDSCAGIVAEMRLLPSARCLSRVRAASCVGMVPDSRLLISSRPAVLDQRGGLISAVSRPRPGGMVPLMRLAPT